MSGGWMVAMTLIAATVIFVVGYQLQGCEEHDGTLVRGAFWFTCVDEGEP